MLYSMKPIEKKELLNSISADDREAFNLFYNLYYDQVFRFSFFFLKDKDACREVISDVFFGIWQSRKRLMDINNLEAWIYIITKNEAIRYSNHNKKNNSVSLDEIPICFQEKVDETPEDQLVHKEIEELLTSVINSLPERCRIIFLMARQEGLKPKEIAEILSINESTVRVQMKIAIEKIIEGIKPHYPNLTLSLLFIYIFNILR